MIFRITHEPFECGTQALVRQLAMRFPRPASAFKTPRFAGHRSNNINKIYYAYLPPGFGKQEFVDANESCKLPNSSDYFSFRSTPGGQLLAQARACSCDRCLENFMNTDGHRLLTDPMLAGPIVRHSIPSATSLTNSDIVQQVPGFNFTALEDFWRSLNVGSFVAVRLLDAPLGSSDAQRFSVAMVTSKVRQLTRQERHACNVYQKGWFVINVRHLDFEKTLLNGGSFFKIQPLREETVFQCNALIEVPPLMLLEESRGRYLLSGASVNFVIRYGAIGDAPKRSRKKRQHPEREDSLAASSSSFSVPRKRLKRWTRPHNDICEYCDRGGSLVCCSFCNLVFHRTCLTEASRATLDDDDWACLACAADSMP